MTGQRRGCDNGRMDLATFHRLREPAGLALLEQVDEAVEDPAVTDLALGTRLRAEHPPEIAAAAVTQVRLRRKARAKFGPDAAAMYFVPEALEQATRTVVAEHRARRAAASGVASLVDLGCGIGSDLIAFARAGLKVRGVERDPVRAAIAQTNLSALGLDGRVDLGDACTVHIADDECVFIDPARRNGAGRTFDVSAFEPSWDFVTAMLRRTAIVKTMPGIRHDLIPEDVEAEWVSVDGQLVEACLWSPGLARDRRRATLLPGGHGVTDREAPAAVCAEMGSYLYAPDDAVIRAGLVTAVAEHVSGWLVDPKIAYVTSDEKAVTPFATAFRVLEELPYHRKSLKAALRARNVGTLTVKKRGVDVVPERLIASLGLRGDEPATLVLTRVADKGRAFLVERLV